MLFATPRSFAPLVLRWALVAIFLTEIARVVLLKAEIVPWHEGWEHSLYALSHNLFPLLSTPAVISRIALAAALFFGFFTRICGLVVIILAAFSHQMLGVFSLECVIAVVGCGLALMFIGGGRGAMDRVISNHLLPRIG